MEIKSSIDVDKLRSRSVEMPYPHLTITDLNNCVPIVVSALEEGDLPLIGTHKGQTKIIKLISASALNINKLLKVTSLSYSKDKENSCDIKSVIDYMEVCSKWIC